MSMILIYMLTARLITWVHVGEDYMWLTVFSQFGDVAVLAPLAHEVGHRFQHVAGSRVFCAMILQVKKEFHGEPS